MVDHTENGSGTSAAWMPYSTTKPKIQAWDPNAKNEWIETFACIIANSVLMHWEYIIEWASVSLNEWTMK